VLPTGSFAVPRTVTRSDRPVTPSRARSFRADGRSRAALLAALALSSADAGKFRALVDTYDAAMHRVALMFVRSSTVADEVA